jgi:hypothetical protein
MIDLVAELDTLLAAWRERRASPIAHAIDELSSWFALALPPLVGTTRDDRQDAWLTRARHYHAVDVPVLLETIATGSSDQTTEQLELLVTWPHDPRTTWLARRLFLTKPYATSSGTQKVWRRLFDVLEHNADPRAKPLLAMSAMAKVFEANQRGQQMRRRGANVLEELERVTEKPSPDDAAWIARIEHELESGRALRDSVRLDDTAGASLLVYRDWLMERGFTLT